MTDTFDHELLKSFTKGFTASISHQLSCCLKLLELGGQSIIARPSIFTDVSSLWFPSGGRCEANKQNTDLSLDGRKSLAHNNLALTVQGASTRLSVNDT